MPRLDHAFDKHWSMRPLVGVNRLFCRVYHHIDLVSPCVIPATGPAVVIANHTSGADPIFLQATCHRMIVWMMAAEFRAMRGMQWLFDLMEIIPVARSGRDTASTRAALRVLDRGGVVGVFPQGRIERRGHSFPFRPGVSLLASRSGASVWPAHLNGTQRNTSLAGAYLLPHEVRVHWSARPVQLIGDLKIDTIRMTHAVEQLRGC